MHSVAIRELTQRCEQLCQLNSQPTAQKLVTTQLQLLRLINKTSLLCWQPDVNRLPRELGVTLTKNCTSTEWPVHRCYGTELLSTHQETVHWTEHWIASMCSCWETVFAGGGGFSPLLSKLSSKHFEMMFLHSVKLWIAAAETLVLLGRRVISPLWFRLNIEGFDFFCCDTKYTGDTYVYVYVIKKYC